MSMASATRVPPGLLQRGPDVWQRVPTLTHHATYELAE
jgi:hypothetical protein